MIYLISTGKSSRRDRQDLLSFINWQDDAVTDTQLGYLRSLLRREGLFLTASDAASMTKGQASHLIELLTEERS